MLIDTHAHIYDIVFNDDLTTVINNAKKNGVEKILLPNIDADTIKSMHDVGAKHPEMVALMIGLHPCSVNANYKDELNTIKANLLNHNYIAIGEIGMDLHWDTTFRKEQEEALLTQCNWAKDYNLPVAIHSRNAIDEICTLLENNFKPPLKGVFHCFTGSEVQSQRVLDLGFYLGVGGVLTFKNSNLKNVLKNVPKNKIILETDSPYLAPTPHRGKRNEPSYISFVADALAKAWQTDRVAVEKITTQNAEQLFNLNTYFENKA